MICILEVKFNLYVVIVGEKLCMKFGDVFWCFFGREWILVISGYCYVVWYK